VSNAMDGHGLVWNPPPFQPVEGYSNFLWALLLWATWSWFGIEPPHAANGLSIACGIGLLAVVAAAALRSTQRSGARVPEAVAWVAVAAVATNRTFVQWLTGGLETALFNLVFVAWVVLAFRATNARTTRWLLAWSACAAAAALTRPDGMLLAAATVATAVVSKLAERRPAAMLLGLLPLLAVVAHLAWRLHFYGEWLPNTYFAKVTTPWPEAGLRYFACFAFENGVAPWILFAAAWGIVELVRGGRTALAAVAAHLPAVAAVAAVSVQVGYYVLRVGGDHFEYRVLTQLVPLGALAAAAMAARLWSGWRRPAAAVAVIAVAGSVGWVQHTRTGWAQPPHYDPLARHVPGFVQPLARWYDRQRLWLHLQLVAVRFERGLDLDFVLRLVPERRRTAADAADIPVLRASAVGLVGWCLPDCAVLDVLGLNDWVAARSPAHSGAEFILPQAVVQAALTAADPDGDGWRTRAELRTAFGASHGAGQEQVHELVEIVLILFARERLDALSAGEAGDVAPFFANLRLMAHERHAPPDYVAAFDPNVTITGREVTVRQRDVPLTAERVRAIEAEWRAKLRGAR
jgi:arabinofuranosyltransferase